ncbi:MAG TPA: glutathione S-transferase family protein [Candidatus Binataceae bacterium]|jgi:glutathione S-transferase|nr:glutathione S-transferase family protein [Candidatus Binataceae bacterium]
MKLYYFPSPNPMKIAFALGELGLACEIVPIDLTKRENRTPEFLAISPVGRLPVLVDGALTLWESHAILAYLGEKTGRLWPASLSGRADALRWLFYLTSTISPPATELVFNRIAVRLRGGTPDEAAIARGEQGLADPIKIIDDYLASHEWMLGADFSLVDCDYGPTFNAIDKTGFSFAGFPHVRAYLGAIRSRPAWQETPKLPGL